MLFQHRGSDLTGDGLPPRPMELGPWIGAWLQRHIATLALRLLRLAGPTKLPALGTTAVRSIVVFRFGGIGDVTVLTGLLRSLRRTYPVARIMVATAPSFVPILTGNPNIDALLASSDIVPYRGLLQFVRALRVLRRWSSPPVDVAIFAHNFFYMMVLALFVRARYKVGFDTNDRGFDFALTHSAPLYGPGHARERDHQARHVNEHFHDLLRSFSGLSLPPARPRILLSDAEITAARATLELHNLRRPLVVLAPGGTEALKIWPGDRFAALARRLVAELRVSVAILGGAGEVSLASRFGSIDGEVWFAAGELPLRQSIAIVHEAKLVLGSDTGMIHVAAALSVPTITIFGPTPATAYGYAGPTNTIVHAGLPCAPCNEARCRLLPPERSGVVPPCLDAITVDVVWEKVVEQLRPRAGAG